MAEPLHLEQHRMGQLAVGAAGLGAPMLVWSYLGGHPFRGFLVLIGICLLLAAYLAWGLHRRRRIRVTHDTLEVGAETFHPTDFDRFFGVQPELVLAPEEQARVEADLLPPSQPIRIAGGAWGPVHGARILLLREATGDGLVAVLTRHPATLSRLLTKWLAGLAPDGAAKSPTGRGT